MLFRVANTNKDGLGLSGLDADDWRNIFASNTFGTDLLKSIADFIKKLCN